MLVVALGDIKGRVASYLTTSISVIPPVKVFLEARQIDTGVVKNPDLYKASKLLGYFFNTSSNTANSLFYMDQFSNNLGWGHGSSGPGILLQWPSVIPGLNTYIPVDGQIANISEPAYHQEGELVTVPTLQLEATTGQPYWAPIYLLRITEKSVQAVITYSEPAYFYDTNEFCCIVGSNVLVNAFEGVLASYSIAKDSIIFIATEEGKLIADSTGGMQQALQKFDDMPMKTPTLPNTTDHQNPVIAHAARYLVNKYGSYEQIPSDTAISTQFKYKGDTMILLVAQYVRNNLKIHIVIVVPYSSFFSKIQLSRRITIALTVIAVIFGFVRYLFAWRLMGKKNSSAVAPGSHLSNSTALSGYTSTISVAISSSTQASSASLFESPHPSRRDIFGDNSPAVTNARDSP